MTFQYHESPFHAVEEADVASKLVLKTDIMIMIRDTIEQQGWTQTEAAVHLDVSQPRISDVMNGKIDKFTLDVLFLMLDVSRPYLFNNILDAGKLAYYKSGTRRNILYKDLLAYKSKDLEERKAIMAELAKQAQELGLME